MPYKKYREEPRGDVRFVDEEKFSRQMYSASTYGATGYGQERAVDPSPPVDIPLEYMVYQSPLVHRYRWGTESMAFNFGDYKKYITWRKLWLYLAKTQQVAPLIYIYIYYNCPNLDQFLLCIYSRLPFKIITIGCIIFCKLMFIGI